MLRIDFISIFPEMVLSPLNFGIPSRAKEAGLCEYWAINPRDFTSDVHQSVDDRPYGGGAGMVMKPQPLSEAIESLALPEDAEIIFTDPIGSLFTQKIASELSQKERILFVCGRYEGIDERVREKYSTKTLSIGDYVLSGGELAALVMTDSIVRLLPGALGRAESLEQDSFHEDLLSYPQYTRPEVWQDMEVPAVLRSGNHKEIEKWRKVAALKATLKHRPDLILKKYFSKMDAKVIDSNL